MDEKQVLDFWFSASTQKNWFARDEAFDRKIDQQFRDCWQAACHGELYAWRQTLAGRLAEIIVLDQFSRNLNRNSPKAWAQDGMALILSQEALQDPTWQQQLDAQQQAFLLMPWMHAESRLIHEKAAVLFEALGDPHTLKHEQQHRDIIDRFGRYPHRNQLLGRTSSPEEQTFLNTTALPFF